ncbi:MAG: hypothetical protein HA490_00660 [Archaeoglobales archaeon]|nr:hypothetical protein [Archaeoglobales archaeon]
MNGAFELAKKVEIVMFVVITIITMASAAPLEIRIEEKVNTTVELEYTIWEKFNLQIEHNVTGYVNITNTGNDPIYDVWIALNLKNITGNCVLSVNNTLSAVSVSNLASFVPDRINKIGVFNTSGANCFVHIPLLNTSGSVSIFYDVNDSAMGIDNGAPFDISEKYVPSKIPAGGNYTWTVYFNVSLNNTWWTKTALGSLSGNNVTLNITKYLSNSSSHYGSPNWTYLNLSSCSTDKGSCNIFNSPYSDATDTDAFNVTNIVLNTTNPYVNITFNVTGNYTNSSAAPYYIAPFGFAVFEFNLSYVNISGSYVVDVFAMGNASINVTKDGPYYDSGYTWWRGNVTITNKASGLSYVVTNVTMWATNQSSFSDYVSETFKCNQSESPSTGNVICEYNSSNSNLPWELNSTSPSVTLPGSSDWMNFSYDKVPIIWANATFKLIKDSNKGWGTNNTTSNDYNVTYGSNFIVIEKIYIIGTYLVKVTKHVLYNSSASSPENGSVFDIYLVVENIGGNMSPYVYVYDLIPTNFSEFNWNNTWTDTGKDGNWVNNSSMLAGNGSQDLSGIYRKGYWWRLMPLNGGADGNGSYEDWGEIADNKTVVIFYQLNGTGDFRVLDVFIVGIDPMYSLNEQTSPKITLVSGAKATNYESTLAAAVFAAIGTAALIVRRNGRR